MDNTDKEVAMVVKNASYTWIGCLVVFFVLLVLLLGISLSSTDLLNWNTNAAAADATRTAVANLTSDQDLNRSIEATENAIGSQYDAFGLRATETQQAFTHEQDQLFAQATQTAVIQNLEIRPTQTAISAAVAGQIRLEKQRDYESLVVFTIKLALIIPGALLSIWVLSRIYRSMLNSRSKVVLLESRRHAEATRRAQAEKELYDTYLHTLPEERSDQQAHRTHPGMNDVEDNLIRSLFSTPDDDHIPEDGKPAVLAEIEDA
jgi:septal ring-binding cell division protein DamX